MKRNQSSVSAQGIAIMRAIESAKPQGERLVYDPYARQMVPGWMYHLVKFFADLGYGDKRGPGVMEFLVARDRYIDDFLKQSLDEGLDQLVILGAGLDSRPYRFARLKSGVKIFEVDHPASQATKLRKLAEIFGEVPTHVTFVAIDFTEQDLSERLFAHGYDPTLKTLFIWQGVTQYLNPQAVDSTLAFVAQNSGSGSKIIFDYMYTSLLGGAAGHGEIRNMRRYRAFSGEDLTFGIPEGQIETYLQKRGFTKVVDANHQLLTQKYFQPPKQVASGYAIVSASVENPGASLFSKLDQ